MAHGKRQPRTAASISDADATAFFNARFGVGRWVFDAVADAWVIADKEHTGPGRGFWLYQRDGSWHRTVVTVS